MKITTKQILCQLKADLLGKDSYRGVTLTYSWLANQFGHFALGFIPTVVLYFYLLRYTDTENPLLVAPIAVGAFWLLFELYNVLGPLLLKRKSTSLLLYVPSKKYVFPPPWGNLVFDTFTDLCFFWLGASVATLPIDYNRHVLLVVSAFGLILLLPAWYWYLTKMYQQAASYPFQFRLAQFSTNISAKEKADVTRFLKSKKPYKHLFVFGSRKNGTTDLAVAIATEKSITHHTCTYTTAMKLFSMFGESDQNILAQDNTLWTWRNCSLLVIDDINPGSPVRDVISPKIFEDMLNANAADLTNKSIIWVMGEQKPLINEWQNLLEKIGVHAGDILIVDLK